jgi:orotate phosphoribosyltransferase
MTNERDLINKYKLSGHFTLASGQKSKTYYDFRPMLLNQSDLKDLYFPLSEKVWEGIRFRRNINVVGMEFWGAGLIIALPSLCPNIKIYNRCILRKPKEHGVKGRVIGKIKRHVETVLIDDVCTTGSGIAEASQYLLERGFKVHRAVVVVNRGRVAKVGDVVVQSIVSGK